MYPALRNRSKQQLQRVKINILKYKVLRAPFASGVRGWFYFIILFFIFESRVLRIWGAACRIIDLFFPAMF